MDEDHDRMEMSDQASVDGLHFIPNQAYVELDFNYVSGQSAGFSLFLPC